MSPASNGRIKQDGNFFSNRFRKKNIRLVLQQASALTVLHDFTCSREMKHLLGFSLGQRWLPNMRVVHVPALKPDIQSVNERETLVPAVTENFAMNLQNP